MQRPFELILRSWHRLRLAGRTAWLLGGGLWLFLAPPVAAGPAHAGEDAAGAGGPVQPDLLARLMSPVIAPQDWNLHWQATVIESGYPAFRSPYQGLKSLTGSSQWKETFSATAMLGARLWEGGELYLNPEAVEGFGLSETHGVAGFPNGEGGVERPAYIMARMFLRQTFGLGGEQESVEDGPNQLAGRRDVSRVTFSVGKMAATDVFDDNAYSHDPRTTFMNWSVWEAGAWDYPCDLTGYTWGATVELNQKGWALRAGYFLEIDEAETSRMDMELFSRGGYALEWETRYALFSRPGKLRLMGWLNSILAGSFAETLADPELAMDIALTRRDRIKYGFVVNVEQSVSDSVGLFSRVSWNDGQSEYMSFTDIAASVSFGAMFKGVAWGRPDDKIGVAGAINALSPQEKAFLAAGGVGLIIGDGALSYSEEKVIETYYAASLAKWLVLTADFQFILDPAYNSDRGAVSVLSARVHAEF